MDTRSTLLSRRALLSAIVCAPAAWANMPKPQPGLAYNSKTAPDAAGREVLARRIQRLDQGAAIGMDPSPAIHRNLPQLVEQNIARMDPARIHHWLSTMKPTELAMLAQTYAKAVNDAGHRARIYELLATRLSADKLGALTQHFGFGPMYAGLLVAAPEKALAFQQSAQQVASSGAKSIAMPMGPSPSIEMTILEIYLEYRTAPIGSLGINGALYETAMFSSKHLVAAWGVGYLVGTGLAWGIQYFAPTLWHSIGNGIYSVVEWITSSTSDDARGAAQEQSAAMFNFEHATYNVLLHTGGDFGVVYEWASISGGGECSRNYWANCDNW